MRWMHKLYEETIDHPWLTLVLVAALTVGLAVFIPQIKTETDFSKFLDKDEPARQATERAEATYGSQEWILVLIQSPETIFNTETLRKIQEMEQRFEELEGVDDVQGPTTADVIRGTKKALIIEPAAEKVPETADELEAYKQKVLGDSRLRGIIVSEDGRAAAIFVKVNPYRDDKPAIARQVTEITREYQGPERVEAIGHPPIHNEIFDMMDRDLRLLLPFTILAIIVVLYVTLRSARGVLIPLGIVLIALVWTLGIMALVGSPFTPFSTMLPIILVAMGVADGIHVLHRYYEDVAQNKRSKRAMILQTMREMTGPVVMTSLTTMAGFLALMVTFLWPQRVFGAFTALGMFFEMILSLTLIPAVLALLPLPKIPEKFDRGLATRALLRLAGLVERRRIAVTGVALIVLILFLGQIPKIRTETSATEFLGPQNSAVRAMEIADESLGGSSEMLIEVDTGRSDGLKDPTLLKRLVALQEYLEAQPEVGRAISIAEVVRTMNQKFNSDDPAVFTVPDDPRLAAQLLTLFTFQGGSLDNLATTNFSKGEVVGRLHNVSGQRYRKLAENVEAYLRSNFPDVKTERVGTERTW